MAGPSFRGEDRRRGRRAAQKDVQSAVTDPLRPYRVPRFRVDKRAAERWCRSSDGGSAASKLRGGEEQDQDQGASQRRCLEMVDAWRSAVAGFSWLCRHVGIVGREHRRRSRSDDKARDGDGERLKTGRNEVTGLSQPG